MFIGLSVQNKMGVFTRCWYFLFVTTNVDYLNEMSYTGVRISNKYSSSSCCRIDAFFSCLTQWYVVFDAACDCVNAVFYVTLTD